MNAVRGFAGTLCMCLAIAAPVVAGTGEARLGTDRDRYLPRREVEITLTNPTEEAVTFTNPWTVEGASGEVVASFTWSDEQTQVEPGDELTFRWEQWKAHCSWDADCAHDDYAGPGRYRGIVDTSAGTLEVPFQIGRYFTLGFRKRPAIAFTVFAARRKAVRQMRAEVRADEPTLIVSGVVGAEKPYNEDWSYTMKPGSIVLGEAFIEVCDAAPQYVEENLEEWRGERWCPWSSFVEREGR